MKNLAIKKPCTKATPQKYDPRLMRFHLDNDNVVDVMASNTLDAERQLKDADIDRKRIVRISFPVGESSRQRA